VELAALQKALPQIAALGATLIAVSPQLVEHNREVVERHRLAFDVLSDAGNRAASQFGLTFTLPVELRKIYEGFGVDLEKVNGDGSWTLPMPGRFIIDTKGTIRGAAADPDYTVRPEPSDTVAMLKRLGHR
jgi:peroxiredoxin